MARNKVMTKDCPSCDKMKIADNYDYLCEWGKSKIVKVLRDSNVKKHCKLFKKG